jgi:hypothetical protein
MPLETCGSMGASPDRVNHGQVPRASHTRPHRRVVWSVPCHVGNRAARKRRTTTA